MRDLKYLFEGITFFFFWRGALFLTKYRSECKLPYRPSILRSAYLNTRVLISPKPDQEGIKLGSMSGTRPISTTSRRDLSSSFFSLPARQGAEGNSRHSDRNISLFASWSGKGLISNPVIYFNSWIAASDPALDTDYSPIFACVCCSICK